jgi:hypothetical protein
MQGVVGLGVCSGKPQFWASSTMVQYEHNAQDLVNLRT